MKTKLALVLLSSLSVMATTAAHAQMGDRPQDTYGANTYGDAGDTNNGWTYTVGAGALYAPTYLGDDEYQVSLVPNIRVTYEDKFFASIPEGVGYNVVNNENWRVGPLIKADFGRDDDGEAMFSISGDDTNDLRGLGDVDGTAEIGGFIEYKFRPLTAKFEARQAVSGHEGLVGEASLQYSGKAQFSQIPVLFSVRPEIKFADSNYHEAYFGVNAAQSARSGLAQYNADAGILSYGLGASAVIPHTRNVSTVLVANYSQLGEQSADSSLVTERGDDQQGMIGAFVNYTF